jgi:hypothetical protein
MTSKRSDPTPGGGGIPVVLLAFIPATLVMVGTVWVIGLADSDWVDGLAVALAIDEALRTFDADAVVIAIPGHLGREVERRFGRRAIELAPVGAAAV